MKAQEKAQNRKVFLDILRVLATCAVVLLHTVTGVKDNTDMSLYPVQFRVFLAVMDLITWGVPVFIMISGYLFLSTDRNFTFRQMAAKYCKRILLALLLFGIPYACIELIITEQGISAGVLGRAVLMVLEGKSWSHMWYLYLILFLYLFTPAIRRILQSLPRVCLYLIMVVLVVGSSIFLYINEYRQAKVCPVLPDTCIYIFYYLCGHLFAQKSTEKIKKAGIPGWVLPTMIGLLAVGMVSNRMLTEKQIQMAYAYPFTVVLAVLLFAWASNVEWHFPEKTVACWQKLSGLCFTIYLIHPVYVNIAYKLLHLNPLDYPLWLSLPLFWLVILLLSTGTAWLLRKIPVLRRYVL